MVEIINLLKQKVVSPGLIGCSTECAISNEHKWSYQLLDNIACTKYTTYHGVPTPPGLFSKISRTWKMQENEFDPGKYWKFKFKALEFTCGSV